MLTVGIGLVRRVRSLPKKPLLKVKAVRAQRAKAGSPDGWGGAERAALPFNIWQSLHTVLQKLEEAPTLPSSWSWVRQTHLCQPKPVTGHRCVSSLRPIAILSVFWRIFIASGMVPFCKTASPVAESSETVFKLWFLWEWPTPKINMLPPWILNKPLTGFGRPWPCLC